MQIFKQAKVFLDQDDHENAIAFHPFRYSFVDEFRAYLYNKVRLSFEKFGKMLTIEIIINELDSVPEPLLAEVLDFIRSVKDKSMAFSNPSSPPRIAGLHEGQVWMSDDFNDTLPDEFWFGDDQ